MNARARAIAIASASVIVSALVAVSAQAQTPQKRAITFKDLISMHRVSDPQISPDGQWIAYSVATPDLDANKSVRNIWLVSAGGESRQLTRGGTDERPRWSPDGKMLAFLSARSGTPQVYAIYLAGGEATRMTSISTGADNELWSPDSKSIAFVSNVYPDCKDDDCNKKRDEEADKNKVKAHIAEHLLYRHWTSWSDGKRSHLFVVAVGGGTPRDLTPGANYDVPPFNLGEPDAIAFSPDSQELAFTANTDKDEALSTNGDIFTVPVSGATEAKRITTNPANDWGPAYSADGKWIAYRAQMQPGYESDRWRLMLYERATGLHKNLTDKFDDNVDEFAWAPDSRTIYFVSARKAENPVYSIDIDSSSSPKTVIETGANGELAVSYDGRSLVFTRSTSTMPAEVFSAASDGSGSRQLTHQNADLLAQLNLPAVESFWFAGADKTQVQALLLRPPDFDASKKYPMLLLVHGGPQGEWGENWGGYRWNPQVMAAPGYVVLMINPRGSFGYGAKFTEEISRDWGGKVYTDLMNGVEAAIAKYPFVDGSRTCAAGGSYGGYMIDWIATHTGRFKCLISHAGPYDLTSMYATEELWFPDWEYGGPPWVSADYRKWSPNEYASNLGKFKTPTLVIGGELDFRVPYTQDLEFFSALQRQEVPSKLVIFPDEGHWVLKPQNSQLWYKTFLDWLATYLK
jgi:dipeptidyl aminopeptidase/acylaminoacyl peptidase